MNEISKPNPFPRGTVVSESGAPLADFRGNSWMKGQQLIEVYRENYFASQPNPGLVMGVRGRFGSGKTHLTLQLKKDFGREPLVARTVYAKIDHPSFLDLYKSNFAPPIMEQINTVVAMHLAKLLRVKTSGTEQAMLSLSNIAQKAVDEALSSSPQRVLELVEQDLLPVGGLTHALDTDVELASSDLTRDFLRAYIKLREPAWSKTALRWFEGDALTPEERDDLGLHTAQISNAGQARQAMRFLLEVHRKAGVPLLLCIDEFERFAVRGSSDDQRASPSFLKDLAEMFEGTGNALLVCGAEDAWRQLPGDTFDRIRRERIVEVILTDEEAKDLLGLYCRVSGQKLGDVFDSGVLVFLTDLSERNARRMLNISFEAFVMTAGLRKISQQDVRQAATKALADDQRFQSMDEAIVRVARTERLGVTKQFSVENVTADYALAASADGPIFLLIMRSSYKTDEVSAGRSAARAVTELRRIRPGARTAVIVLGYSTAEVREQLQRVSDAVLVYDEDRFAMELTDFLRTAPMSQSSVESKDAVYNETLQRFADIENKRIEDFNRLAKQLEAMQEALHSRSKQEQEERVTDKIGSSIAELQGLLQQEQNLVEGALPYNLVGAPLTAKDGVLRILDSERALTRRLEVLNDGLPEAGALRGVLEMITWDTDRWEQSLDYPLGDLASVRSKYRERQKRVSELELRHIRRLRRQIRFFGWQLSLRSLATVLLVLTGIVFDISVFITESILNWRLVNSYYASVLDARSMLSQMHATPQAKDRLMDNLLKARGELDRSFLNAKAEGLPMAPLTNSNTNLIQNIDALSGLPTIKDFTYPEDVLMYVRTHADDGVHAADELLADKPSVVHVTFGTTWPWMVIGLVPFFAAVIWWLGLFWYSRR
jgi:hypothetical protein